MRNPLWQKQLGAILALPVVVTIVIPALLIWLTDSSHIGWGLRFPLNLFPIAVSIVLLAEGLLLVTSTVQLFITMGSGTLAPWSPTQHLVVAGIYRFVRNPMITGVFIILLSEAIFFRSRPLLIWSLLFLGINLIYMPLIEEPGLRRRFGKEYDDYARNVPRWVPRRTPWTPQH